jgi:TatD DNase family protein
MPWIDSHCHLDAPEFAADRDAVRQAARQAGVGTCVIPAVEAANFDAVRQLAHQHGDVYALGIHPLFTPQASEADLQTLNDALQQHRADPRLVAVGEIGLDGFVPRRNSTGRSRDQ